MIYILLIGIDLLIRVYNQNVILDNSVQELSLYKIKNKDQELTIWIRFQTQFIDRQNQQPQIPFAIINKAFSLGQIIITYQYTKQLDIRIQIPILEYSETLVQFLNYDRQQWINIQFFKDEEFKYVLMNDKNFFLPSFKNQIQEYYGNFITWQNFTFSLKGYIGNQESVQSDLFYLCYDPIVLLYKQIIKNYKDQIQIEMFLRKKNVDLQTILLIRDQQYDYQLIYGNSTVSIQIRSEHQLEIKLLHDINNEQWFKYIIYFDINKTITQINTFQEQYEWVYENKFVDFIEGNVAYYYGMIIYFNSISAEIDNIVITNRLDNQNQINNCFPGCKKCIKMDCLECELNLNISNQCSCEQNQFYNYSMQSCQDISKYEGIIQNERQVVICELYEYFNYKDQKCMKCPRIDQYYCTDCVFNTELWKLNQTCTFQEIYTNIYLTYLSQKQLQFLDNNTYQIIFNHDYNQSRVYFNVNIMIGKFQALKCVILVSISIYQKYAINKKELTINQQMLQCKQGYAQINYKCLKCPLNCVICEFKQKRIQCVITKEGFYISCNNDSNYCLRPQQIQQFNQDLEQNCFLNIKSDCLFCDSNYILDQNSHCSLGEGVSKYFNFEYFSTYFNQLSLQQLIQIAVNQDISINRQTLQQIQFYGRQYQNIKLIPTFTDSNNNQLCLKLMSFNKTNKCIKFNNNYTQIQNNYMINYCNNQECTYNLTLKITIYISNIQKVLYKNKTFNDLQELLSLLHIQLYFSEIIIMAEVYVFDSLDQKCQDQQIFILQDQFKDQFYQHTQLKLILIFKDVSQFPGCWSQNFQSNFKFIEVINLQTYNKGQIRFYSTQVKFINCLFLNNLEIIITASQVTFQNTSFVDSFVNNTLIQIYNEDYIQEIQFISCNFYNISIEGYQPVIDIKSYVFKMIINNLTAYQMQLFNTSFINFDSFHEVHIEFMQIVELDCFLAMFFSYSLDQSQKDEKGIINFNEINLFNSSLYQSVFYERDNLVEFQNFQINKCKFYDSFILIINNKVILQHIKFYNLLLDKTYIFFFKAYLQNITLKDMQIFGSLFNSTSSFISIEAHSIALEKIDIYDCSYSPPTNIINIKATLGTIQGLTLKHITHIYQIIIMLPNYFFNLEIKNIKITQTNFLNIEIDSVKLLYIQSEKAEIFDLFLQLLDLQGVTLNEIIKFSLLNKSSFLKMENLQLRNIVVQWMQQSQLISIQGNRGIQYITKIIIENVKSIADIQIFYCARNKIYINDVKAQFFQKIGFSNQYQSEILIKNYKQKDDRKVEDFQWWTISIFTNIDYNSIYEQLTIQDSTFIKTKQPIIKFIHNSLAQIIVRNVNISEYQGFNEFFNLLVQDQISHFFKLIFYIDFQNLQIRNTFANSFEYTIHSIKRFIFCQSGQITLSQIYFINSNIIILEQYWGRYVKINNIYVYNSKLQNASYFILLDINQLISFQNIYFINQIRIYNMFELNFTNNNLFINLVSIQNIYINSCDNCLNLIKIDQEDNQIFYHLSNFFIKSSNFCSDLIKVNSYIKNQITIQNLMIYNTKLYQLVGNSQKQIIWHFSTLSLIDTILNYQIIQDNNQFYDSYLQNCTFNGSQIAIINQTMILNQYQKLLLQPIYLSLKEQFIFNSTQIRENVYQVYFNKNQTFVYVPTGRPLSKFIYINPITKQQENPYDNFIIILNSFKNQQISCSLNQSIDGIQGNFSNINEFNLKYGINIIDNFTFYMNPYLNYTYIQNDIICNNITLRFHIRTLPCQLGEYLYQNQCLICDISKNYYSVTRKAQFCQIIDNSRVKQLKVGNIQILPGFWRAKEDSNQIEQCLNELCQGGWTQGDDSCVKGYVGSLCRECDIYNKRGQGRYAVQDDGCQICQVNYEIAIKGILISIWLVFLGYLSYNTNKQLTQQYLFFKISKRNVADILMRQSTNQISIIFKIFTNYIFFLYLLKDKLDFINYQVNISFAFISNPNSQLKPQLDCLLVEYHQLGIHYIQLIISIISPFYTLSFLYLIYLILLRFKVIKFQFNLVLITIYSVYLFNQQIIFQNQIQLLSYTTASNIQWINLNQQFQFDTKLHHHMMYYYILPSTLILILIPGVIFIILKTINKRSIKSTKYFGTLFTEYKSNSYYWEIVRIYQKYLIIGFLYVFKKNLIIYLVQFYLALMIFYQPYFLKNINYLEQKSFYILISSLINILLITDQSKQFRALLFSILNLILIYDVITNFVQKGLRQNRNLIIKIYQFLVKQMPIANRWIRIEKFNKLSHNMDILRNIYKKQKKIQLIHPNIQKAHPDFERLETEIEMIHIKK